MYFKFASFCRFLIGDWVSLEITIRATLHAQTPSAAAHGQTNTHANSEKSDDLIYIYIQVKKKREGRKNTPHSKGIICKFIYKRQRKKMSGWEEFLFKLPNGVD